MTGLSRHDPATPDGVVIFAFLQEPPFCFTDASGAVTGCDVELARAVCDRLGLRFRPVETEFAALLPGLIDGRWTMTTGLFVSEERSRLVDFTRPVWALADGLLVARDNPLGFAGYRSFAEDSGALLGVITDQVQGMTALGNGIPASRIKTFATQADVADAVATGRVHAYASVAMAHRGYLARLPDAPLAVVDVPSSEKAPAFGAFALSKADATLREAVDAHLGDLLGSGWHRGIMARYGFSDRDIEHVLATKRR
ncbi:transporter substrate-binding domain-containing protein [Mesorhizobium sp. ASY16-5R]|uniref:transporter substrate-binding domain-containing protein n=1 Tax=Mesorhizobium sp. ASY16-5R TaxID=3445772 RepID=UPI003FA0886D